MPNELSLTLYELKKTYYANTEIQIINKHYLKL